MVFYNNINPYKAIIVMQQDKIKEFKPQTKMFNCPLCKDFFERPTTLSCGHTYCLYCLTIQVNRSQGQPLNSDNPLLVPICPECQQIIWRPLSQLKENVVIANLMATYQLRPSKSHPILQQEPTVHQQYNILVECHESSVPPMPFCSSQVVFTTAFMDQIVEQQSQTSPLLIQWPGAPKDMVICGRISRPEIYHLSSKTKPYETTFRAQFDGLFYAKVTGKQELRIKVNSSFGEKTDAPIQLCRWQQLKAKNPQSIASFNCFFDIYDKLNNPVLLRQIGSLVQERVMHERNDPQALIYCFMRLLRLKERQVSLLIGMMDDKRRWEYLEEYILKNGGRQPTEVIKVNVPGNYPNEALFLVLFIFIAVYYFVA